MKKALIITYYWPPSAGGGVQRWLKFAKYLRNYGWEPVIFTPENPAFQLKDETLAKDIPEGIEILKIPIFEPYRVYSRATGEKGNIGLIKEKGSSSARDRLAAWARANLFIPDPKIFWVRPSVKFLKKYLSEHKVDVIISTGPPHSMHLIPLRLKKTHDIPWLADFRDMWSLYDILHHFKPGRRAIAKNTLMEKKVHQTAEKVLTITNNTALDLEKLGERKVEVITNGFDEDDFQPVERTGDKFIISHFGLLNSFRNPRLLWEVLDELCNEDASFAEVLELRLGGMIDPEVRQEIAGKRLLADRTVYYKYLSHDEVIRQYYQSAVLLLLLNNTYLGPKFMTGKIFEYLAVKRPILAVGAPESDAAVVLQKTQCGEIRDFNDRAGLRETLLKFYNQRSLDITGGKADEIRKYTRKNLTQKLASLLDEMA